LREGDASDGSMIRTVRGAGYMLACDTEQLAD
jgi:DNA-binding response OmpR family regulator